MNRCESRCWNGAVDELPENPEIRTTVLERTRPRASSTSSIVASTETLDRETDLSQGRAFRDRALVYLLALSGVRGAEAFATPGADRRSGVSWIDADPETGPLRVLEKPREYAQLPNWCVRLWDVIEAPLIRRQRTH